MHEHVIALSFDSTMSPGIQIQPNLFGGTDISSWGFSWYPSNNSAVSTFKGGQETTRDTIANTLSDWDRVRSTTFLCQLSNTHQKVEHENIQPFSRNVLGKDWVWIARGNINTDNFDATGHDDFYCPVGKSLEEVSFCHFLNHATKLSTSSNSLQDISWQEIYDYFNNHDVYHNASITLSDGQIIIVYRGKTAESEIYLTRRTPPHGSEFIENDFAKIDIVNGYDPYRSVVCISSLPFLDDKEQSLAKGGLVVIKRGTIRFEKEAQLHEKLSTTGPLNPPVPEEHFDLFVRNEDGGKTYTTNVRSMTATEDGQSLNFRLLNVRHKTTYKYEKTIKHSTHIFRLAPVEDDIQEVVNSTITFSKGGSPVFYEDSFGNKAAHLTIEEPYNEFSVTLEATVKIYAQPPDDFSSSLRQANIPLLWMPWQRQMMLPYLLPSELPESQLAELSEFAMSFVERNDYDLMKTINDINNTIFKDFSYVSGSTSNNTTAFEVYTSRQGVCQDFANLFICLTRILSIPARYRTGYIYTGGNYENKIQSDASHAWVEVYLPYVGWRGFDPTNGCLVNQDHIRIASGRNFVDATPTAGTIYEGGGGRETLQVDVKVTEPL